MATITLSEAASSASADAQCHILLGKQVTDLFFGKIPFVYIDGHELRAPIVDASQLRDYATVIGTTGGTPAATFPAISGETIALTHLASILEVDSLIPAQYGNKRDILRALKEVKVAALLDLFRYLIVNGDSSIPGQPLGLLKLAEGFSNVVSVPSPPGPVGAGDIEDMLSLVQPRHGFENRYLVMHSQALKHIRAGAYQNEINFIEDPDLGPIPTISGCPVLINDHLPLDQGPSNNETSIVGVILEPGTGFFGVLPCRQRGREIRVTGPFVREGTGTTHWKLQLNATFAAHNLRSVAVLDQVVHA